MTRAMKQIFDEIKKDKVFFYALIIIAILAIADFFVHLSGLIAFIWVIFFSAQIKIAQLKMHLKEKEKDN